MTKVIDALQKFEFPVKKHPIFPERKSVFTFPTLIKGGKAINIAPDFCVAFGDIRILPGVTQEYLENIIKRKINDKNVFASNIDIEMG